MKLIVLIIIGGCLLYLLLKFALIIFRPFLVYKTLNNIDEMYGRVLDLTKKNVEASFEELSEWEAADNIIRVIREEDHIYKDINDAKSSQLHEEEMYSKFIRLRERFLHNNEKLSESIIVYQRYLKVRLKQIQDASIYSRGVTLGVISFDEMRSKSREEMIILEENERTIDILLRE